MRFVAAAMVFFFHATFEHFAQGGTQGVAEKTFIQGGWTGVGFFFVLSGFILTWSTRPRDTTSAFYRRRFFKVYPLHLLTMIAAAVLMVWFWGAPIDGWQAVGQLFLVHSWSPDIMVRSGFNGVAWSLSCELFFYALFPVLIRIVNRIRPERLWLSAGVVVALVLAVPFAADLLPDQTLVPMVNIPAADMWLVYMFPGTRLLDFVFGIILAKVVMTGRKLPLGFGGSLALVAVAYIAAPYVPGPFNLVGVMLVPLGLLVASGAAHDSAGRSSWFAARPMVWLGEISFAFYMLHQLVQSYGHRFFGLGKSWDTVPAIGIVALLLGITVVLSWLAYSLVERPVMKRFAGSRPSRRAAAEPARAPAEERQPALL
ncbi:acyltransferase [Streptomyces goshikiensis]|uniref:acyltransferase family protein n=1 Tax=Streptomyces goshikiensis TaxID=1942 RepID=UPI00331D08D2